MHTVAKKTARAKKTAEPTRALSHADSLAFIATVVDHASRTFEFDTSAPVPCEPEALAAALQDGRERLQRAVRAALAETPEPGAILAALLRAPSAAAVLDRMTVGLLVRDRAYTEQAARALVEFVAADEPGKADPSAHRAIGAAQAAAEMALDDGEGSR